MTVSYIDGYYFPPNFTPSNFNATVLTRTHREVTVHIKMPVVTQNLLKKLCGHLKQHRNQNLMNIPMQRILDVLHEASLRWLDKDYPLRRQAEEILPAITGFSKETISESIDIEMESSLKQDMLKALKSEMGNPGCLDDFQYSEELGGFTRAYGPELMVSYFSENIPSLPHLLFMRAALVKSACLGKTASGEPVFAALYLKTLEEIDPDMVESMAALYWVGGDAALEASVFEHADAAVVFGGPETCASLTKRIPRHVRVLIHGHKMGFSVLGKNRLIPKDLETLARKVAYDHAMFDQQACLAPQVCYVEKGGEVTPEAFAKAVSDAMATFEKDMPRGRLSAGETARIHQLRAACEIRELMEEEVRLFVPEKGTSWTVVYEKDPGVFSPSPLNRFVRIWGVDDISKVIEQLKPVGLFLQNAAVDIGDDREKAFIENLGRMGVARITAPGNMPVPSMMWHHDGIATLASLLRWCDIEKKEMGEQ